MRRSPWRKRICTLMLPVIGMLVAGYASAASNCDLLGFNNFPQNKRNKLYLYFPAADDWNFKEFGDPPDFSTRPARKFNIGDLFSYTGTAADLQQAIVDVVTDDYCEFNVEVIATSTPPPSTFDRRNTVAIGTDSLFDPVSAEQWGQAEGPDVEDKVAVDFARVWAGTYQAGTGGPGGELEGTKSTLDRWARAIGGTVAHEAGHNYGMAHKDGYPRKPDEDPVKNHLMADGSVYSYEQRAGFRRHFSNNEYSMLASNVGLSVQSMFNWTLINPNQETATAFGMHFVSLQPNLTLASVYTGTFSPWAGPTLIKVGPTNFRNDPNYFEYQITWNVGHKWVGGQPGQVPGGVQFSIGASFNTVDPQTPDSIIIVSASLTGGLRGGQLALHPRVPGFDAGTLNVQNKTFDITVVSADPAFLVIENATVQFLSRLVSMESLLPGTERLLDPFELPVQAWSGKQRIPLDSPTLMRRKDLRLPIAGFLESRVVLSNTDAQECQGKDTRGTRPDTKGCKPGTTFSLFPATATLLTVDVVDPAAKQWSRRTEKYVIAPLITSIRYQVVGQRPSVVFNGISR